MSETYWDRLVNQILNLAEERGMKASTLAEESGGGIVIIDDDDESYHFEVTLKKVRTI